jgi:glycosyltransferase involved in cell wall biosynthesis
MLAYNASSVLFCREIIKQHKIDRVIAFMSIPSGITALYIKKVFHIPYIVFLGGGDVPGHQSDSDRFHKFISPLRRLILKNAKHIVAVSEGLARLSQKTDRFPVKVIHTGVDSGFYTPPLPPPTPQATWGRQKTGIPPTPQATWGKQKTGIPPTPHHPLPPPKEGKTWGGQICFLYTGRFAHNKNIPLIIEQFHLLIKDGFQVKLLIVGDGPTYQEAVNLTNRLGISDYIDFLGWVNKPTLLEACRRSDIYLNASTGEGLSNAIIEAMSCGLAVIASDVIGNNELIQHQENGLLFSLNEKNGLYKAMKTLLTDNELLNTLKRNSRDCVLKNYTWEQSAREYIKLLSI